MENKIHENLKAIRNHFEGMKKVDGIPEIWDEYIAMVNEIEEVLKND